MVDCGSGHASVLWYSESPVRQLRRSRLNASDGKPFRLAELLAKGCAISTNVGKAVASLEAEIADARSADGIPAPSLLFVGATGGLREALAKGACTVDAVDAFQSALEERFSASIARVRFVCLTGEQEAAWELDAAHQIWTDSSRMFPGGPSEFGLFSGGGQSMQLGVAGHLPLSWPFSTWWDAMDEAKGASDEAWRQGTHWADWEDALLAQIRTERERTGLAESARHGGSYVLSAMNEVACKAAGIDERPTSVAEAIVALRQALAQFKKAEGDGYVRFIEKRKHYKYNVARVTAMHVCRLAHVLDALFAPEARLYAPDARASPMHCEWALGAFVDECARIRDGRKSVVAPFTV